MTPGDKDDDASGGNVDGGIVTPPRRPQDTTLRRRLYEAVLPLDRGDFRWEFLVPWLPPEKRLTRTDKIIVCSVFIGIAIVLQETFDRGAPVAVHLSYIAQFFSYAMGNPIGYRVIAIVSSLLEVFGDLLEQAPSSEDGIPVLYNLLFLPINAYYLIRWLLSREALLLGDEEQQLYDRCFAPLGFDAARFSRLLGKATFLTAPNATEAEHADGLATASFGTTLCVEGEPLEYLYVSLEGEPLDVVVDGVVATTIPPFQVIGEASLLECLQSENGDFHPPSRATIVAEPGARYARWSQRAFFELQQSDATFAYTIQLMIARTLSHKLQSARLAQQRTLERTGAKAEALRELLSPEDEELYVSTFKRGGVTPEQFSRLMLTARWVDVAADDADEHAAADDAADHLLASAGERWDRLVVPVRGRVEGVNAGGGRGDSASFACFQPVDAAACLQELLRLSLQQQGDADAAASGNGNAAAPRIGESSLDVVARPRARYVSWRLVEVHAVMRSDAAFAAALQTVLVEAAAGPRRGAEILGLDGSAGASPPSGGGGDEEDANPRTVDLANYGVGLI